MKIVDSVRRFCPLVLAGGLALGINISTILPAAADNEMAVQVMGQQAPPWGGTPLGTSPTDTIATEGCAVTAVAMLLRYYGIDTDPGALNAWLTANGGYAFDDQLVWSALSTYSGGDVALSQWTGPDMGLIHRELDAGRPVIAEVSLYGNQHFVLILGYHSQTGLVINDPWFGDSVNFATRYGDPAAGILSIRTFSGTRVAGPQPSALAIHLSHLHLTQ